MHAWCYLKLKPKIIQLIIFLIGIFTILVAFFFIPIIPNNSYHVIVTSKSSDNKYYLPCNSCFKFWLIITGGDKHMQIGDYQTDANMSYEQLRQKIIHGIGEYNVFTIKAGSTNQEIISEIKQNNAIIHTDILNHRTNNLPLLPMTIRFNTSDLDKDIYAYAMDLSQDILKKIAADCENNYKSQFLIVASIITKESAFKQEYPYIAAVIYNRLAANMPLQVNVYPDSYKKNGLPKKFIANPNIAALIAACHPASAKDLLFYVADGKQHVFSQNFQDHRIFKKRRHYVH